MAEVNNKSGRIAFRDGESVGRAFAMAERFNLRLDSETGLIRSEIVGYWASADALVYIDAMKSLIVESRLARGSACLLVDRRTSPVQSLEVSDLLRDLNGFLGAEDRLAMIVSSTLLKLQLQRITVHSNTRTFTSHAEAMDWVLKERRRTDQRKC